MPRELTTEDKDAMKDLMKSLVGRTFVPDAGVTLGGQPVRDWLAGPAPSNPLGAMQHSMGRSACNSWARGEGSGIPPRREALMRDTCSPYIASIGTVPGDASFDPPYTGGQCVGTVYSLSFSAGVQDYLDGRELEAGSRPYGTVGGVTFVGPISKCSTEPKTYGTTGLPQSWRIRVISRNGTVNLVDINPTDIAPVGGRTERRITSFKADFIRVSGSPSQCGNVPPEWDAGRPGSNIPDPAPITSPPGFDIPFPGVTVKLNPDGTISIDFGDGGPPLVVDPGTNPDAPSGADPGPPEAGTPGSTGEGGDDEGDAPEGKELWALKIDIDQFPTRPNEYAPGVYRGVCYVYMGDENGLDHDPAGAMLRDGQLVLAEREGLTKYRVTANLGYNLTVTPYWRTPRKES
jgi:hypothetical protein